MSQEKTLKDKLAGLALTDVHICEGDNDHGPHIDFVFGDMEVSVIHGELGLAVGIYQVKPVDVSKKDFHLSPGVLQ